MRLAFAASFVCQVDDYNEDEPDYGGDTDVEL